MAGAVTVQLAVVAGAERYGVVVVDAGGAVTEQLDVLTIPEREGVVAVAAVV